MTKRTKPGQFWATRSRNGRRIWLVQSRPYWEDGEWWWSSRWVDSMMPRSQYEYIFSKKCTPPNRRTALLIDAAGGRIVETMEAGK